jgi:hypothetical protein
MNKSIIFYSVAAVRYDTEFDAGGGLCFDDGYIKVELKSHSINFISEEDNSYIILNNINKEVKTSLDEFINTINKGDFNYQTNSVEDVKFVMFPMSGRHTGSIKDYVDDRHEILDTEVFEELFFKDLNSTKKEFENRLKEYVEGNGIY